MVLSTDASIPAADVRRAQRCADARAHVAQARIQSLGSVNMIICPMVGGFLANLDIRLPFVVGLAAYGAFI